MPPVVRTRRSPTTRPGRISTDLQVGLMMVLLGSSMLVPALYGLGIDARRSGCADRLRRMGTAIESFEKARRHLPAAWYHPGDAAGSAAYAGGFTQLLPHLGQAELFDKYDRTKNWWDEANQPVVRQRIEAYECPAAPGDHVRVGLRKLGDGEKIDPNLSAGVADYWMLRGYTEDRLPRVDRRVPASLMPLSDDGAKRRAHELLPRWELVTDGRSQALLLAEKGGHPDYYVRGKKVDKEPSFGGFNEGWATYVSAWVRTYTADGTTESWTKGPCTINCQNGYGAIYAFHQGGANFLFADGSARFLGEGLSVDVYLALLSRSGGELLAPGDYAVEE